MPLTHRERQIAENRLREIEELIFEFSTVTAEGSSHDGDTVFLRGALQKERAALLALLAEE
jgi:hypothetical protein